MSLHTRFSCLFSVVVLCSTHSALAADFTPRLTSHGHPDLQGNWTSETATPFQREEELGEKKSFTVEEAQEWERNKIAELNQREAPLDGNIEAPEIKLAVDNTAENQFKNRVSNVLAIDGEYRTSIVVDPPNGRLPLRDDAPDNTFEGKMRALGFKDLDGPEMAGVGPRCLLDFGALPPAGPIVPISPNFLFVQNEDYVVLYIEAGAELRIIRLSEELLPDAYNQWRGDSIGYWEGNTLIVNTTSFHPQSSSSQLLASDQIEVQERFTIISENEIFYRFTITDPEIYTQPFTGELMLTRMPAGHKIYDYTCHEGNYSLPGILAGARRQEAELENSQN